MQFVETPVFTKAVTALLDEERYRALQLALALRPEQGDVIRSSGGLRKLRWGLAGLGKRAGIRVIYYWDAPTRTFYMLYVYTKQEQGDLTFQQIKVLSRLVQEEFK